MDWSPDGKDILVTTSKTLALISAENGSKRDIYSFKPKQLTERAWFSPDGEYIAFEAGGLPPNYSPGDIRVYSLERGRIVASLTGPSRDTLMGWMPKGKRLLFSSNRKGGGWYTASLEGDSLTEPVLVSVGLGPVGSVGIENGALYLNKVAWENDLYLVDYDPQRTTFSKPKRLGTGLDHGSAPAWSPDGEQFVYARNGPGTVNLALQQFPGGDERQVALNLRRYHFVGPQWSSNGHSIVVGTRPNDSSAGLVSVDVATEAVTPLVQNRDEDAVEWASAEWATASPKGITYYVWIPEESSKCRIVGRNSITGKETTVQAFQYLKPGQLPIRDLAISPDGTQLAFLERVSAENRPFTLSVLKTSGGSPRRLYREEQGQVLYRPAWTPNGDILFGLGTTTGPDSELQFWKLDPKTGARKQLMGDALMGRALGGLSVHPDGRKILFTASRVFADGIQVEPSRVGDLLEDFSVLENIDRLAR